MNEAIAEKLREAAELLERQGADGFRTRAYRRAADTLEQRRESVAALFEREGIAGLLALPNVGQGIASAIVEMIVTGRWSRLDRLRGELDPVALLRSVPGLGPKLAERIHERLHIESLEALEAAAHDGRLDELPGFGARRLAGLRATLNGMLGRVRETPHVPGVVPPVETLLDVDREYRERASHGELPTIAPRRMNPRGEAWLPILHVERDGWHFTALFSNTARAHKLHRTGDWVVLFYSGHDHREGQATVVTESRGVLQGRRVVRGHEAECVEHYRAQAGLRAQPCVR